MARKSRSHALLLDGGLPLTGRSNRGSCGIGHVTARPQNGMAMKMTKQLHMISALLAACLFLLVLSACAEEPPFDPESLDTPMETELNQVPGAAMEVLRVEADSLLVHIR